MIRSVCLLGQEVLAEDTGKMIGRIRSVIFNPDDDKILGITINCGKWLRSEKFISSHNIKKIGRDAVVIKDTNQISSPDDKIKDICKKMKCILDRRVMKDSGEEIGFIQDIIINEDTFNVEGYVLTDGIIDDIIKGKTILPYSHEIDLGNDAIIIKGSIQNIIMKNDISLKKYLKDTCNKVM